METTSFKENSGNCEMPRKSAADFYKKLQKFHIEHSDKKLYLNQYTLWQHLKILSIFAIPVIILFIGVSHFFTDLNESQSLLIIYATSYLSLVWLCTLIIKIINNKYSLIVRDKYELKSVSNFDKRKDALKKLLAEYNQVYHKEKLENIHQYLNDYKARNTSNYSIFEYIISFIISIILIFVKAIVDYIIPNMGTKLDTTLIITIQVIGLVIMIVAIIFMWNSIFSSGNKKHYHVTFDLLEALILGEDWDRVKQEASQDCNTEPDNE